jgi:hypothetical protein
LQSTDFSDFLIPQLFLYSCSPFFRWFLPSFVLIIIFLS